MSTGPRGQLIRSEDSSLKKKKKRNPELVPDQKSMMEHTCSTAMLVSLLCRWSQTLGKDAGKYAKIVLQRLIEHSLPATRLYVYLRDWGAYQEDHTYPATVREAKNLLEVSKRAVRIPKLVPVVPVLKGLLAKRPPIRVRCQCSMTHA